MKYCNKVHQFILTDLILSLYIILSISVASCIMDLGMINLPKKPKILMFTNYFCFE